MTIENPNAIQLYSAATPNGNYGIERGIRTMLIYTCSSAGLKAAIALEELVVLRASKENFVYEPHTINIRGVENKKPDFLEINPNGKNGYNP